MFKYKSISPSLLILNVDGKIMTIRPNQEFTCPSLICNKFIVEVSEKPQVKEVKKFNKSTKDEV